MYTKRKNQGWLFSATILLLVAILAGCGSNNKQVENTVTPSQEVQATQETQATQPAATDNSDSEQNAQAEQDSDYTPRTIKHALGEETLTKLPERVVVLDWGMAEHVLALGIQPVGIADIEGMKKWVNVPLNISEDVVDIGERAAPDLELVASLKPDLIIGLLYNAEKNHDMLKSIATTLIFDTYPQEGQGNQYEVMLDTFHTIATALDREAEEKAELASLEEVYKAAREKIAAAGMNERPVVLAMGYSQQNAAVFRISTDNALAISILENIGLTNAHKPEGFEVYGFSTADVEALPALQDATFLHIIQDDDNIIENILKDNPVWKNLHFVKENRVFALGGDTWPYGGTLAAKVMAERTANVLTQ